MSELVNVPKWYWIIAVLAVLWNFVGGYDYYNSITVNEEYLGAYGQEMIDFVVNMPTWAKGAWGIAILSSIVGSICLLLRNAWAFKLYIVAFVFMIISFAYQWTADSAPEVEGGFIMSIMVFAIAIFLIWFSKMAKGKGWLK